MKSTIPTRSIANPRRTQLHELADLKSLDGVETVPAAEVEEPPVLPAARRTANPRRTVLDKAPGA